MRTSPMMAPRSHVICFIGLFCKRDLFSPRRHEGAHAPPPWVCACVSMCIYKNMYEYVCAWVYMYIYMDMYIKIYT